MEATNFEFFDEVNTNQSSWINKGSFYSCDGITGYFILRTNTSEYIHSNVPMNILKGFKQAKSFDSFYNRNLKNRYRVILKNSQ